MNTVSVTLGDLVDRSIFELHTPQDLPYTTATAVAIDSDDTSLTLAAADRVNVSDVLEIGAELLLVTAKTLDPTPVLTVSRGYYGSTAVPHTLGETVALNPRHPRVRIAEAVRRSFSRLEALGLPMVQSSVVNRTAGLRYVQLPADTRDVVRVGYLEPDTGTWVPVDGWFFYDDVPTGVTSTGKLLRVPRYVADDTDLIVTRRVPYRWSTHPAPPDEAATVSLIEGAEDLPMLYATCWLVARREISRTEIDRAEEWMQGEPSRGGVSAGTVRVMWQEFYRALDEARRLIPSLPTHRPFVRMPKVSS